MTRVKQLPVISKIAPVRSQGVVMAQATREEDRPSEDEIVLKKLGPQGVPGAPDTAKMTPQVEKQMPRFGDFDGHTA
jgi:dihydroxyacid dehydratase/phosphogluconate dehydratase